MLPQKWTKIIPSLILICEAILVRLCRSFAWIVPGILLGGEKRQKEKARVRKGINVLISTPGRLIDHITHTKCLSLAKIKYLVLDEGKSIPLSRHYFNKTFKTSGLGPIGFQSGALQVSPAIFTEVGSSFPSNDLMKFYTFEIS